ncbi:MAG: hypothetical protein GY913_25715 [Proteobacteria bacterium]|nr:hypothetical protein [Pseudomonadota bacterium]MCP4920313.1 hypothetical protein [Pseudomonadota bacterium]
MPTFQIDAGEAFKKGLVHQDGRDLPRAELIRELLVDGGLDAFVPGPTDYDVLGTSGLAKLPNVVSATWTTTEDEPLFPASVVLEEDGIRLGVIGLSAVHEGLKQRPPVEAAREALASLPDDLDLVLVVSNLDDRQNREIAVNVDGYAVLVTTSGSSHEGPRHEGDVLVIEPPPRGRYLTVASMWLGTDADRMVETDAELGRTLSGLVELREVIALRTSREEPISEQIARLEAQVLRLRESAAGRNITHIDDRGLGSALDGESTASKRLDAFREKQLDAAVDRVASTSESDGPRYGTGASCVSCHTRQVANWGFTAHAKAAQSLRPRGEHQNPECVGCHSTGFGEPGGFADVSEGTMRTWGNVQCEACHGPLAGHPRDGRVEPQVINESTCVGCHDEANSPNFDYATYIRQVTCPSDEP